LHDHAKISRIVATSFQSVSGAGRSAMDELFLQTKGRYMNEELKPQIFPKRIAFNIIPKIGNFLANDYTSEEDKVISEVKKILDPNLSITATCVRVPVFVGHSISLNIEFENNIDAEKARKILSTSAGVEVLDKPKEERYATPIECVGEDEIFVSRIRNDNSRKNALNIWIVSDNLRKGAALNAVQIAEELVKRNYL
jgi:aspartate-semialdehyde dehydrogenase